MNYSKLKTEIRNILIISSLFILIFLNSLTTVPTGYVGIKLKFGKADQDVVQEGLNIKLPINQ